MSKYLLITADDFGMCHSVNAGILRAMTKGIVRSTNFLVPCPWFPHAMQLARQHRLLAGVHLCVTCDWDRYRWGPITRAESLRDDEGYFLGTHEAVAAQAREADIYAELAAQIVRVKSHGYQPTHLDTHMMGSTSKGDYFDMIKAITLRLGREHDLIYTYDAQGSRLRYFADESGVSGRSRGAIVKKLQSWKRPGAYHLIGHAAEATAELDEMASPEHPSKEWTVPIRKEDMAFFVDDDVRTLVASLGFELVSVPRLLEVRQGLE